MPPTSGGPGSNQYVNRSGGNTVAPSRVDVSAVVDAVHEPDEVDVITAFGAEVPRWQVGSPVDPDTLAEKYGERFRDARLLRLNSEEYDGNDVYRFEAWLLAASDVPDDHAIEASVARTIRDCFAIEGEDGVASAVEDGLTEALETIPAKYWRANGIIPASPPSFDFDTSEVRPQFRYIEWDDLDSSDV